MRKKPRIKLLIVACGIVCFLMTTLLMGPSRMSDPVFHKIVARNGDPYTGAWEQDFEVKTAISQFRVQTRLEGHAARLRIDLEGKTGDQLLHEWPIRRGFTSFSCGKDVHGVYTLRVREDGVTGRYSIEIGERAGSTRWQKSLVLFVSLLAVSGIVTSWQRYRSRVGRPAPALVASRALFLAIGLGLFLLFFYLLLHEGGHALASIVFGNFDLHRSDFFGIFGNPHSGINPAVRLAPWQSAIQSIAGPLLPIVIGYVLFAFWRSRRGTAYRGSSIFVDVFWSFTIVGILVSALGFLIPMTGVGPDTDYSGFANSGFLPRWQANALLLTIVLINACLLCRVVPGLVMLRRRLVLQFAAADKRDVPQRSGAEQGAAPNGGPATSSGNSGVTEGPPSVS